MADAEAVHERLKREAMLEAEREATILAEREKQCSAIAKLRRALRRDRPR